MSRRPRYTVPIHMGKGLVGAMICRYKSARMMQAVVLWLLLRNKTSIPPCIACNSSSRIFRSCIQTHACNAAIDRLLEPTKFGFASKSRSEQVANG